MAFWVSPLVALVKAAQTLDTRRVSLLLSLMQVLPVQSMTICAALRM
jgi:hypothetical protein